MLRAGVGDARTKATATLCNPAWPNLQQRAQRLRKCLSSLMAIAAMTNKVLLAVAGDADPKPPTAMWQTD